MRKMWSTVSATAAGWMLPRYQLPAAPAMVSW